MTDAEKLDASEIESIELHADDDRNNDEPDNDIDNDDNIRQMYTQKLLLSLVWSSFKAP